MKYLFPFLPRNPTFLVDNMHGLLTGEVVRYIPEYMA